MEEEGSFREEVERRLEEEGFPFEREASVSGVTPDILIRSPTGRVIVVEVKQYEPDLEGQARAYEQARYYREVIGADTALFVLPGLKKSRPSEGVVSLNGLLQQLRREFAKRQPPKHQARVSSSSRAVFAAMPFASEYNDVYYVAIAGACDQLGLSCRRVDLEEFAGDIVNRIEGMIQKSVAVVADVSDALPNVMYEVGYAHALQVPTVHISSTPLEDLPFDVRNWNTLPYNRGQTFELTPRLKQRLDAALND